MKILKIMILLQCLGSTLAFASVQLEKMRDIPPGSVITLVQDIAIPAKERSVFLGASAKAISSFQCLLIMRSKSRDERVLKAGTSFVITSTGHEIAIRDSHLGSNDFVKVDHPAIKKIVCTDYAGTPYTPFEDFIGGTQQYFELHIKPAVDISQP